jgi:hypothetical protein
MTKNIKTTTDIKYLSEELAKCYPLREDTTYKAAIIEWRLKHLGHF